jgi:hypothetical protein
MVCTCRSWSKCINALHIEYRQEKHCLWYWDLKTLHNILFLSDMVRNRMCLLQFTQLNENNKNIIKQALNFVCVIFLYIFHAC